MSPKYTIENFNREFPTSEACLEYIFKMRFPALYGYKKLKGRQVYQNNIGFQISPMVGTAFEHSSTSLKLWFYAIYLFSQSKMGVSSMELRRQLGTTYKTAWLIGNKIRASIKQETPRLSGVVECDEAYVGGKRRLEVRRSSHNKTPVFGIVERSGKIYAIAISDTSRKTLHTIIKKIVKKGSTVITDSLASYQGLNKLGYKHKVVNHTNWEYVRKEKKLDVFTNTIENFWHNLKSQLNGTHYWVGKRYLQQYLDEVVFRYNYRDQDLFRILLHRCMGIYT